MSTIRKIIFLFLMIITSLSNFAQQQGAKTTDTMRSNGRIYVVVAVVLTILAGLILYVARLDRKMSKLEKEN